MRFLAAVLFCAVAVAQPAAVIGSIDFFGHKGIDVQPILAKLPVQAGAAFASLEELGPLSEKVEDVIESATGKPPTEVGMTCCDAQDRFMLFIGLPGETSVPLNLRPKPTGTLRLSSALQQLHQDVEQGIRDAVLGGHRVEDRTEGYALSTEPKLRALQIRYRDAVRKESAHIYRVLAGSANEEDRAAAATAAGYLRQSKRQRSALIDASRDPSASVRNNAVRALAVLLQAFPKLRSSVPPATFVRLLTSATWVDRNKGGAVVAELVENNPKLAVELGKSPTLDALIEMSRWHNPGHAASFRAILARIAGVPFDPMTTDLNAVELLIPPVRAKR